MNFRDIVLVLLTFAVFYLLYVNIFKLEHMQNTNPEAYSDILSMYNDGVLRASNIEVTGDISVGGKVISDTLETKRDAKIGGSANVTGYVKAGGELYSDAAEVFLGSGDNRWNISVNKDNSGLDVIGVGNKSSTRSLNTFKVWARDLVSTDGMLYAKNEVDVGKVQFHPNYGTGNFTKQVIIKPINVPYLGLQAPQLNSNVAINVLSNDSLS